MDANLVNPFIEATLNVLETTASTEASAGTPYIKTEPTASGSITGVIELSGEFKATIAVSFNKEGILAIVSKMFGEELSELNDEIKDAVGEISNMISGQATNSIAGLGDSLKAKLSTVILEENHTIPHIGRFPVVAFPFTIPSGAFTIELCFKK